MKFRKISAVFFWFFVALVTSAQAVVTISPTHIRAGQSVFLDFSGVPAISLGAVDVPIPPGGSIDVQVYDYQFQTWQSVLANGSTQGSFEAYGCSASSFISCSPDIGTLTNTVKLTYDQPGLYSIDYSILKLAGWYGVYSTFDANGEMVNSGFGGPYSQILVRNLPDNGRTCTRAVHVGDAPDRVRGDRIRCSPISRICALTAEYCLLTRRWLHWSPNLRTYGKRLI